MEKKHKSGIVLGIAGAVMAAIAIAAIILAVVGATAGIKASAEVAELKSGHVYRYALENFRNMGANVPQFVGITTYKVNVNNNANPEYTDINAFENVATGTQNTGYIRYNGGAFFTDAINSGAGIYDNAPSTASYYNYVFKHADGTTTTIGRSTSGWYVDVYFDNAPTFTGTYAQQIGAAWVQYATDLGALTDAPEIDTTATATIILPKSGQSTIPLTGYKVTNAEDYANEYGYVYITITLKDANATAYDTQSVQLTQIGNNYYYIPMVNNIAEHITAWSSDTNTAPTIENAYYDPTTIEVKFRSNQDSTTLTNTDIRWAWQYNTLYYAYFLQDCRFDGYNDGLIAGRDVARSEYETALGVYASMDIVSGIFSKIGEILNIPIFGSIPLYVFVLIPLIMGVIYVILKFVR